MVGLPETGAVQQSKNISKSERFLSHDSEIKEKIDQGPSALFKNTFQ